jgi:hypothetical protein
MSDETATTESIVTIVPKLEFLKPGQPRAEVKPSAPLQWLDMSSWDQLHGTAPSGFGNTSKA